MTESPGGPSPARRAPGGRITAFWGRLWLRAREWLWSIGRRAHPPGADIATIAIEQALNEPGCPVCRLVYRSARRWLWMFLWESVTDPERRAALRESDGFCPAHWWLLHRVEREGGHSRAGAAILAEDVLSSWAEHVRRGNAQAPAHAACLVCGAERRSERSTLEAVVRHLARADFQARYEQGDGACFNHTWDMLKLIERTEIARIVINGWTERAARLSASADPQDVAGRAAHISQLTGPLLETRRTVRRPIE